MVEAGKHGAGACLYFRASVLWYVVFFSMAIDDRGLNLTRCGEGSYIIYCRARINNSRERTKPIRILRVW